MPRPRRAVAALCIALTALAVCLPSLWSLDPLFFEPQWILLSADGLVAPCPIFTAAAPQPIGFLAGLASRGPPSPRV
jgi:hypothetical protein